MHRLTFDALRAANTERIKASKYQICEEQWTPAHWMQATVGELGELANLLKKVDRGDFPLEQVKNEVAKELADVQTYLDILALKLGVDLGQATIDKFNEVSERIGSPVRLGIDTPVVLANERLNRVYLAGPMTGIPEHNFPAFHEAATKLRATGLHVENPAEHGFREGAEWADYLRYDLGRLSTCECVVLLPGWEVSRGVGLELSVAKALGMQVLPIELFSGLHRNIVNNEVTNGESSGKI